MRDEAPDLIGLAEAAQQTDRSERTMRNWCMDHGIGRKVGGRWKVYEPALNALLANDTGALIDHTRRMIPAG